MIKVVVELRFFVVVLISILNYVSTEDITLLDEPGNGMLVSLTTKRCYSMKPKWSNRATKAIVEVGCFWIYKSLDCTGDRQLLPVGSHDLKLLNWGEKVNSMNLCSKSPSIVTTTPEPGAEEIVEEVVETLEEEEETSKRKLKEKPSPRKLRPELPAQIGEWAIALEEHNKYRKLHNVPELDWSRDIDMDAEAWATYLANTSAFETTTMGKYGNNLATSKEESKEDAVRDAVQRWYEQIKDYDFDRPGYNVGGKPTGSFSAVVWRKTTHFGIGVVWSEKWKQWIVNCFYYPPASRSESDFQENVPPPQDEETNTSEQ